jgi:RNA polymerase sigma-70 factor (ECF subfamily)
MKVSEAGRILLTLKEVEGLSLTELDKIYLVSQKVLKVRLFRARRRVLKTMKDVAESLPESATG